ncbi:MAG: helix-turn-helix transcriptional regulator [Propionibacteriaceae bacterium]|jgi:transcriptional regulator with XRE-family HTH domain|nr:helix-turn-helix transcriptional regulator [Propionibacteriaceae bacterium]
MPVTSGDVSALVTRLMKEQGIGVRELARRMNLSSHSRLSDRLNGTASWKLHEIFPLADALGVTPGSILDELQASGLPEPPDA